MHLSHFDDLHGDTDGLVHTRYSDGNTVANLCQSVKPEFYPIRGGGYIRIFRMRKFGRPGALELLLDLCEHGRQKDSADGVSDVG